MTQTVSTEIITSMQWQNVTRSSGCSVITYYKLRNTLKTQYRTHYKKNHHRHQSSTVQECIIIITITVYEPITTIIIISSHCHLSSTSSCNYFISTLIVITYCKLRNTLKTQCTTHYNLVITIINRQLYKNTSSSSPTVYEPITTIIIIISTSYSAEIFTSYKLYKYRNYNDANSLQLRSHRHYLSPKIIK